jgi:hypothetical protein
MTPVYIPNGLSLIKNLQFGSWKMFLGLSVGNGQNANAQKRIGMKRNGVNIMENVLNR